MRPASIWRPAATSGLSPAFLGSRRIRRTSFEARDYGAGFSFLARLSEPMDTPRLHVKAGDAHLRWPQGSSALPALAEALSRETPEEEESGLLDARGAEHAPYTGTAFPRPST